MNAIFENEILSRAYHKDPTVFRVNELSDHAYFIPFDTAEHARSPRESSPFFHSLCGKWRFRWCPSVYELSNFYAEDCTDIDAFKEIDVPECWQAHGDDYIQYQSSPYPFIPDAPRIPEKNPVAAYIKDFDISPIAGKRYELHFEGKDSCVYVWMNGQFAGYGEVPHNDSAFDVTPYIKNGKNRLCVAVLKWCTGTYFDDQDKLRLSGLFREVYLLERAQDGLRDFSLRADMDGSFSLSVDAKAPVRAEIYNGDKLVASATVGQDWSVKVESPALWSAETPDLYDLVLTCADEVVRHRFGFRRVNIENGVFKINGRAVKIYGVNRHDSSPDTGCVTNVDFMKNELLMMKRHNINAIRTSHYPSDPRFFEMCDALGFYVMCEADQECHGMTYLKNWSGLVDDPLWGPCIHDRIDRMYQAFKNSASVVIWSLGNESGWGQNLNDEAIYLKKVDPARPVHYESAFSGYLKYTDDELAARAKNLDFISAMYPRFTGDETHAGIDTSLNHPVFAKMPYVMCEYSHAMGNSCGDLRFYDELIQQHDRFMGGYIWEWCDHTMRLTDENGTDYFGYGGDFGEHHHMRNVCMDGTVTPERVPHSNLLEAKAVFAPVRVTRENGTLVIKNRYAFRDFSHLRFSFSVVADNNTVDSGELTANPVAGECVSVPCPTSEPYAARNAALTVSVALKNNTPWADAGHVLAAFSFPLETAEASPRPTTAPPTLTANNLYYTVSGKGFAYGFRRDTGLLEKAEVNRRHLLAAPLDFNCFRAPLDNDITAGLEGVAKEWSRNRYFGNIEYAELSVHNFTATAEADAVVLTGDFIFGAQGRKHIARGTLEYRVLGDGRLVISQKGEFHPDLPYFLPRYGVKLALAAPAEDIRYYGYGPAEAYEDKCSHALLGEYGYLQDDPVGNWEKPQESGNHCGTEWVTLRCGDTKLQVSGKSFSFNATRYDIHQMAAAKHRKDLRELDHTELYIDYRMSGVGSHSCGGQDPVPECRINGGEAFDFSVSIEVLK